MGFVIVTGAAGGIGQALTHAFTDAGHSVIGVDQVEKPQNLSVAHYVQCDLARTVEEPGYAEQIFSTIRIALDGQPLDALINNAAVQILGKVEDLHRAAWRQTLDVNLVAPFLWAQAFLPELEAARGSILNISSIHARLTKPNFVAYATSKAALSGMTRAMAVEIGSKVPVNAIEPAAIETEMLRAGFEGDPSGYQSLLKHHPSAAIGQPADLAKVATAALHIIGTGCNFLNGSIISFDGGIASRLHDPA